MLSSGLFIRSLGGSDLSHSLIKSYKLVNVLNFHFTSHSVAKNVETDR